MKPFKKNFVFVPVFVLAAVLISWQYYSPNDLNAVSAFEDYTGDFYLNADQANSSYPYNFESGKIIPPAEDVLVKLIPNDNNHLLIIAYYPKNIYSTPAFSLNFSGTKLIFFDNGKGYDEKPGDGLYTAIIATNIKAFKEKAVQIREQLVHNGTRPVHFENRSMVEQDIPNFDINKFDGINAVSISNLKAPFSKSLISKVRENCIFITDLKVVEDPTRTWNPCTQTGNLNGCWSFKTIFQQLASPNPQNIAGATKVSNFVKKWLTTFTINRIINSDSVAARPSVQDLLIDPWLEKSRQAGNPKGFLDMRFAPFKLIAIVNRFDLRSFATGIPAGEGRLIFCLIDSSYTKALPFTFICEYGIPMKDNCEELKDWATQWYNLKDLEIGSENYNQALQAITDQFTLCGNAKNKPNQNCLNTVRTNDRFFGPLPIITEFREFHLNNSSHQLTPSTVAQIPADKYNAHIENEVVQIMVKYINENSDSIINFTSNLPKTYEDKPLLAGAVHILDRPVGNPKDSSVYYWDGTKTRGSQSFITSSTARHIFSLNSCTGCHAGELQTNYFHVEPVFFGSEAILSGFLTGHAQPGAFDADHNPNNDDYAIIDPALRPSPGKPTIRKFNDIARRARDLKQFATTNCDDVFKLRDALMFKPISAPH